MLLLLMLHEASGLAAHIKAVRCRRDMVVRWEAMLLWVLELLWMRQAVELLHRRLVHRLGEWVTCRRLIHRA